MNELLCIQGLVQSDRAFRSLKMVGIIVVFLFLLFLGFIFIDILFILIHNDIYLFDSFLFMFLFLPKWLTPPPLTTFYTEKRITFSHLSCLHSFSFGVWGHINLYGLFNAKAILAEEHYWYYLIHSLEEKRVHTFPKNISPKVNARVWLEFKCANYDITVLHNSHYVMGSPS